MVDTTAPWYDTLGDTLGLPGIAGVGSSAAKYLLPAMRGYGARAIGSLAASPFAAALAGAQVMEPTETGEDQPWYVRDPATGQMVPNPAKKFDNSMVPQYTRPQVPGSAPVLPVGSFNAPQVPQAPYGAKGIGSDYASGGPTPASVTPPPTPAPQASLNVAPAAATTPLPNGAAPPQGTPQTQSLQGSNTKSLLQKLFNPMGSFNMQPQQPLNVDSNLFGGGGGGGQQGGGLLSKIASVPSQIQGALGMSQFGPTFANGSAGMMGGVPFSIF